MLERKNTTKRIRKAVSLVVFLLPSKADTFIAPRIRRSDRLSTRNAPIVLMAQRNTPPPPHGKQNTRDSHHSSSLDMSTALGIVPPDGAWDQIQRARHFAQDVAYRNWPPCIRLFHPFSKDLTLDVAEVIEKYQVEPFQITLESWSVIPNLEAMEADWKASQQSPAEQRREVQGLSVEQEESERLIRSEERIGRENRRQRLLRQARKAQAEGRKVTPAAYHQQEATVSPTAKQKNLYEEYNGPCLVCVEPDQETKDRLQELRGILCEELGLDPAFSATSACSGADSLPLVAKETEFRALLPIGSFSSVESAVEIARKLRASWTPVSFNVTDFQVVSCDDDDSTNERAATTLGDDSTLDTDVQHYRPHGIVNPLASKQSGLFPDGQFGCHALIMFVGEESESESDKQKPSEFEVLNEDGLALGDNEGSSESSGLELWLDEEDEDVDEGTVIVKGRTLFFTGETRDYVGMPAMSVFDARDRPIGDALSGAARRRGAVHRSGVMWNDGEFGIKEKDRLPWGKRERKGMSKLSKEPFGNGKETP